MDLAAFFLTVVKDISYFSLTLSLISSCHTSPKIKNSSEELKPKKDFILTAPSIDEIYSYYDTVHFTLESPRQTEPDSVLIYLEGKYIHTEKVNPLDFNVNKIFSKVGRQNLRILVHYHDSLLQTLTTRITVLSDLDPELLTYKLIRKIPHNPNDFTQGFIYQNGWLYEGTGRRGLSSLKKLDPEDGSTKLERKMGESYFGEGITIFNNKIYQLTYRQKVGFIYDIQTFELIREFDLQTMEGWGLTTDGKSLIVSDGSSVLYFYDPEYLNQIGQLDVSHNKGLAINLNELEYVDGSIWANVYGESYIVKIDAETGKVLARLDLEALYPKEMEHDYDHVLNGIAYNPDSNTYYVTGKLWPLIYEIVIYQAK